jgi:2-hydroxychromene-2-carboxylate isomerase
VSLIFPENFESRRLTALAFLANDKRCARTFLDAAWDRVWAKGGPMGDEGLIKDITDSLGWNWDEVLAFERSGEGERWLVASNTAATERGVFGIPAMLVDDQMWWGNDRLAFLDSYLKENAK